MMAITVSGLPAHAQPAADFFAGRQVTLLIGGGPGGSVDIYGRMVARYIARHLHPTQPPAITARNFPASGGVQAYMALATTAAADGSVFTIAARGPLTDPLWSTKPAGYDVRKFIWIGSMSEDATSCYTMGHSKIRTLADAQAHETTMAATGVTAESGKFPHALNATIGTRFKVIAGYSGTQGTLLAIERGETDGRCTTFGSLYATQAEAMRPGKINHLVQIGASPHPAHPSVPMARDIARTDADKSLLDVIIAPLAVASAFALPPGAPGDRTSVWRAAFAATMKDEQFADEARRVGAVIMYRDAGEVTRIVDQLYATPKSVLDRARKVFEP
jgi:tripartite-type tricarboxylate transporter receptor subunit TctC